jgi:hypothetical protein
MTTYHQFAVISSLAFGPLRSLREKHRLIAVHFARKLPLTVALPLPAYIDFGQNLVDSIDGPLLVARVDGVAVDGQFTLMELELIEPYLFLSTNTFATRNFVDAIARNLKGTSLRYSPVLLGGKAA